MASMEKALSMRERLPLTSPERRLAMTECLIRLSHISLYQGKREYAGSLANRAIAIGGQDLGSAPMHESLARAYSARGEAADPQTGSLAFLSDVREAIRHQQEAARIDPKRDQRLLRTMLANGLFNSGLLNGQLEVAEEASEAMRVLYTDAKRGYYLAYLGGTVRIPGSAVL
jgi:tetratricopeptide (TPR) repeat protein